MKLYAVVTEQTFVDHHLLAAFTDYDAALVYKAMRERMYINNGWGTPKAHDTELIKESHFSGDSDDEAWVTLKVVDEGEEFEP